MNTNAMDSEYEKALAFLFGRIDFERQATVPYKPGIFKLDRMRELLRRLGNPQNDQPIVHVAGTKGKGSTATMIASILKAAGARVGLFTSPHLRQVEERFAIDGVPCSPEDLLSLVDRVRPIVEAMDRDNISHPATENESSPTFFEITTAIALQHFADRQADVVVLEVGMGGRLDSTNVCQPIVSVITSIDLDHTEQLGESLAEIAAEKAGIIKPGVPVISGVHQQEPRDVIRQIARSNKSRLIELKTDFDFTYHAAKDRGKSPSHPAIDFRDLRNHAEANDPASANLLGLTLSLLGKHQGTNASVAIATVLQLRRQGLKFDNTTNQCDTTDDTSKTIDDRAIANGLSKTVCPARIEVLSKRPMVVVDVAHNVASIKALLEVLNESFAVPHRILIIAATRNKDYAGMLRLAAPQFDQIILTRYENNPRSVPTERLHQAIPESNIERVHHCPNPSSAWQFAKSLATGDSLICITGSFFIAAEMRSMIINPIESDRSGTTLQNA